MLKRLLAHIGVQLQLLHLLCKSNAVFTRDTFTVVKVDYFIAVNVSHT